MEITDAAEMNRCDDGQPSTKDPDDDDTASCRSSLSPPIAATAGVSDRRCRRSSPLLSVLLASVGDHRDDVNAQSILEDHLLRVWDETTAAVAESTTSIPCRCRSLRYEAIETADSRRMLAVFSLLSSVGRLNEDQLSG